MKKVAAFAFIALACWPVCAFADGKFFSPEKVPPDLPYQRALIAHDGSRELLILQSKFEGEAKDFGWVVPLPAVPELASMTEEQASLLFHSMERTCGPRVISVSGWVYVILFLLCFCLLVTVIVYSVFNRLRSGAWPKYLSMPASTTIVFLIFICFAFMIIFIPGTLGSVQGRVKTLHAEQVGIYDVKVIGAEDSEEIVKWLNEHGYKFDEKDEKVFDSYIERGWCFVTARVDLEKAEEEGFSSGEGLVNPLVMLFESQKPVYPLALTGTIGSEVEILLYLFNSHKVVDASGRFALRYAGETQMERLKDRMVFEPEEFIEKWDFKQDYLTKLKAKLTPEMMKKDLMLEKAPDDEPYREHVYRW